MRIYVACLSTRKSEAHDLAQLLRGSGHEVVSTWHENPEVSGKTIPANAAEHALRDRHEVMDLANLVVVVAMPTGATFTGGGHCTEVGMAIGCHKPVIVVGDRSNIFYHLPEPLVYQVAAPGDVPGLLALAVWPGVVRS